MTTQFLARQSTMLAVIAIGVICMFAGEVFPEKAWWAPILAFIVLRAYVVMQGKEIRERAKNKGTAGFWTWGSTALAAAYITGLHFQDKDTYTLSLMISLHVANIMLVAAEIYYSILSGKHPAELKNESLEKEIESKDGEIEKLKDDLIVVKMSFDLQKEEIEKQKEQNENLSKQIESNTGRIQELELANEFKLNELGKVNQRLTKLKKSVSIIQSVGKNYRACYCPQCSNFNSWGIAAKNVVCSNCGYEIIKVK